MDFVYIIKTKFEKLFPKTIIKFPSKKFLNLLNSRQKKVSKSTKFPSKKVSKITGTYPKKRVAPVPSQSS